MGLEYRGQTVGQVVKTFMLLAGVQGQNVDEVVQRVCAEWGCNPEDNGEKLFVHLLHNMRGQNSLTHACFGKLGGAEAKPEPELQPGRRYCDFPMNWHEVGPGTDPNRFLSRADEGMLCQASVAVRERYGR